MSALAVLLLILDISLYVGQNFFNKLYSISYTGPAKAATPMFSVVYGVTCAFVALAFNGFRFSASGTTWILGIANGVTLFLYNLSGINAARRGPFSFQILVSAAAGILTPLLFSQLVWGEKMSVINGIGAALMLCAIVLYNIHGLDLSKAGKAYYLWLIVLAAANGAYSVFMQTQQRAMQYTEKREMIIITFAVSALISVIHLVIVLSDGKTKLSVSSIGKKAIINMLICSTCAAFAVNVLMYCINLIPAYILYPTSNGSIMIINALLSVIVLKDKLNPPQYVAIAAAATSIVLLNI